MKPNYNPLTKEEEAVIVNKSTERAFTGEYDNFYKDGVYICRRCSNPLFSAEAKFKSGCGWPSFDDHFEGAVKTEVDADGRRTEILCANCDAHLGHVFEGEHFTDKNTRHCVNSLSIKFIPAKNDGNVETIYLGGGCFWCTEALYLKLPGVTSVESGYSGGHVDKPTYDQVSDGDTGHAEVVKVTFDNSKVSAKEVLEYFFKIHDPTTLNQQGNDVGTQYRSIILYTNLEQKKMSEELKAQDVKIVTEVVPFIQFYKAEDYHQDFYNRNKEYPYCRIVITPKVEKYAKS